MQRGANESKACKITDTLSIWINKSIWPAEENVFDGVPKGVLVAREDGRFSLQPAEVDTVHDVLPVEELAPGPHPYLAVTIIVRMLRIYIYILVWH